MPRLAAHTAGLGSAPVAFWVDWHVAAAPGCEDATGCARGYGRAETVPSAHATALPRLQSSARAHRPDRGQSSPTAGLDQAGPGRGCHGLVTDFHASRYRFGGTPGPGEGYTTRGEQLHPTSGDRARERPRARRRSKQLGSHLARRPSALAVFGAGGYLRADGVAGQLARRPAGQPARELRQRAQQRLQHRGQGRSAGRQGRALPRHGTGQNSTARTHGPDRRRSELARCHQPGRR